MSGALPKIAIAAVIVAVIMSAIAVIAVVKRTDTSPDPVTRAEVRVPDASAPRGGPPVPDPAPVAPDPSPVAPDPSPSPAARCAASCDKADDCKTIPCSCEDGTVVNTRNCNNNCCLAADEACSSSCGKHDGPKGSWNRSREGGNATGKGCRRNDDCASKLCVRGYCSHKCDTFGDCPPFWECAEGASAFDKICRKT